MNAHHLTSMDWMGIEWCLIMVALCFLTGCLDWRVLFGKLRNLWWARQRSADLKILWPVCREQYARDLDRARAAFAIHAFHDPCWISYYGSHELVKVIKELR